MKKRLLLLFCCVSPLLADIRTPRTPRQDDEAVTLPGFRRQQKIEKKIRKKPTKIKRKGLQGIEYRKFFSEMNFEELKAAKNKRVEKGDFAIGSLLEQLINSPDCPSDDRASFLIELADLHYNNQQYEDAAKQYKELIEFYPGNKQLEYAHYRLIICTAARMLSPDRDQSKTEETIELTNEFLERSIFTQYRPEVETIRTECYERLAKSELNTADFYIKRGNTQMGDFQAAQRRLEGLRSEWLDKAPTIEVQLAQLETDLSSKWDEFKAPDASILLAKATDELKPKKQNMALKF